MNISKRKLKIIILEEVRRALGESNGDDVGGEVIDLADYDREEIANFNPNYDPYPDKPLLSKEEGEEMRNISDRARTSDVEDLDDEFEAYLSGLESGKVVDPFDRD